MSARGGVLVTGARGCVGRAALPGLLDLGYEVHAVASSTREVTADPAPAAADGGVEWHRADLLNPESRVKLIAEASPTHLLHFAWHAPGSWSSPENRRWAHASLDLVDQFARRGGHRVVIAGSCAEYDYGSGGICSEDGTPLRSSSLYGASKHDLHEGAQALAERRGLSLAWGRIFSLYGPGERPERLVPSVARALIEGRPALCTEGSQVRDFLYSADVAAAFADLVGSNVTGALNIGSGVPVTVREIVSLIAAETEREDLVHFGALPLGHVDPPRVVADVRRLHDQLGFAPSVTLAAGIAQTVSWWRACL